MESELKPRIIVLIDFSPYSRYQLEMAERWSEVLDANIILLHRPFSHVPSMTDMDSRKAISEEQTKEGLKQLKAFSEGYLKDTSRVTFLVDPDPLPQTLRKLFREPYYNFIFAGLKGTGLLKKILMGSTVTRLVDELNAPLIAVPKNPVVLFPETLYVGVSYKYPLNTKELDRLIDYLPGRINTVKFISVVHGDDETDKAKDYLEVLVKKYSTRVKASFDLYEGRDTFYEIKQYMLKQTDGIFVAQRGTRSMMDVLFRKFLINDLIYDASIPFLILPENES